MMTKLEQAAEQPAEQEQAEPSPTSGMNIAQRILHVGGRNNSAGYVEFGSIQAVQALVNQVIRDLPRPRRIPDHELVTMYDESPSSDADMIAFAHDVMDAMIYNSPRPARQPPEHDEDLLEQLYWEFDHQRQKTGEERLAFKGKMRFYASEVFKKAHGIGGEV